MSNTIDYKGYTGSVEFSPEDRLLYGKVLGIKALISYEGTSADELVEDFQGAVDDYLALCASQGVTPEKPYTAADLDWHDKMSRSSVEMADEKSRPALAGALPDMGRYETVFIGYPIWWGIAPRIVQTFAEACDLKGRTVIPFCTSGGSPFGKSADLLIKAAPMARWKQGARLMAGTSDADIAAWAKGLGITRQ